MKRKLVSLALALVMCLGLLPTAALAAGYTEAIPCQYDSVENFSEGLAAVAMKTGEENEWGGPCYKWGFIDTTGKLVIPCQYDGARSFSEGLAAVEMDTGEKNEWGDPIYKWGFIDTTGKLVIPYKYEDPYSASSQSFSFSFTDGILVVVADGKYGVIDKTGKEIVPCKYNQMSSFSGGLATVSMETGEENEWGEPICKWGVIDQTGKEVVPCKYDEVSPFSEGLAAVHVGDYETGKWGFIDKTGKEVVPCKYDGVNSFSGGLVAVTNGNLINGQWGFVDATGKEVVPYKYTAVWNFSNGLAAVRDENLKWGFIDATGKEVVPCKYDYANLEGFSDGFWAVELDDKWGFIDTTGKEAIPCQYDEVESFSEGLAAVRIGDWATGKWGFIDTTGREVVPCKYNYGQNALFFSEGIAAVRDENDKLGFIDKTGKQVAPFQYDGAAWVGDGGVWAGPSEGFAAVCVGEYPDRKWGFVSVDGSTAPAVPTAQPSTQTVNVDGENVEFAMYALEGGSVNYIRVRDLAALLNGTAAQFEVGWDGNVTLTSKTPYTGATDSAPFHTEMAYTVYGSPTYVDGKTVDLDAIQIEYQGGGFTYYKLRDLAQALGFNVGWSAEKGVYVETDKPYDPAN